MKNTMKINQVIVLVTVILIGTSSFAKERNTNKEEKRGVVAGMVVGSAIAGPIGAGVGAILGGGIFGKLVGTSRINRELESELQDQKISHQQEREEMKVAVLKLGIELGQVKKNHVDNWNRGELPVQFRTNSSDIEVHYESELNEIALNLSQNRSSQVTLSGFADRRGRADLNQILSADRVIAVKTYLIGQGVQEKQIVANAFGETKPLQEEESVENNFFDRRVVLQFSNVNASVATR
jgi:sortase system peptidoglycan-associated protein